jgi:antitoxin (DNA-binding transcriptional repressor) of toxin-antitoxin stability system
MKIVNIHHAKTHLSRLLEGVANGESFVIAKSGKPVANVTPTGKKRQRRIGFMKGMGKVPDDFNTMFAEEIADMFEGKYDGSGHFENKK